MRNRQITLLDIGLDDAFDASMTFVQSTIQSLNAGWEVPIADVNFVRSRDPRVVAASMMAPTSVLHVMAHGEQADIPQFVSTDGRVKMDLAYLHQQIPMMGRGISAGAVLADGCKTATGVWQRAVRDCLQGPVTYIGTSAQVDWHDGTVFASVFYGALFRNRGKGASPAAQAAEAGLRAINAYREVTRRSCPYRVVPLEPSKKALRAAQVL